jgi:Na+-translocating ferredoxin:NAD+ oxidoreductase RnfC subunit
VITDLAERVRRAGVVGAGGAGFPAHVKFARKEGGPAVDTVIANGAECEPLLHKDAELMAAHAERVVAGLQLSMAATGAGRGIVALKEKHAAAIAAFERLLPGSGLELHRLGNFYPTGDEFVLVYECTGRLIPTSGIPLDVGVVVHNVESLANIAEAVEGRPVTHKMVTVAGAVTRPLTCRVPLGVRLGDLLDAAGGPSVEGEVALFVGGVMMGRCTRDLDLPVTKTTAGIIVLSAEHPQVQRHERPETAKHLIGKSACDQCSYCTELCPRYLLGHPLEPHKVMRGLVFSMAGADTWNHWGTVCCECGLCTLYACPEDLYPREACQQAKATLLPRGEGRFGPHTSAPAMQAHPLYESRRTPLPHLVARLGLTAYDGEAPLTEVDLAPRRLVLPLKQHAGVPATPTVAVGARVEAGDVIADIAHSDLGAALHAPLAGVVTAVDPEILIDVN